MIDRPRRIAYASTETNSDGSGVETSVEIVLGGLTGGKTLMTLVERGFPSAGERDLHAVGLPRAFDRVGLFVRARVSGER